MNKIKKIIYTTLLAFLGINIFYVKEAMAYNPTVGKIAVVDFKNDEKCKVSDLIISNIAEYLPVVERTRLEGIVKEQGFQLSGFTDYNDLTGKIKEVDGVVVGAVGYFWRIQAQDTLI